MALCIGIEQPKLRATTLKRALAASASGFAGRRSANHRLERHTMDDRYLITSIYAAIEAGGAVLDVYETDFEVERKSDDSPLTLADNRSHSIISNHLDSFGLPILSEEGRDIPYVERKMWDRFWLIDPLDGTKEFVKRNGEFTVNIALIANSRPVSGVIYVPVTGVLYFGAKGMGSHRLDGAETLLSAARPEDRLSLSDIEGASTSLPDDRLGPETYTIVGSRSHQTPELHDYIEEKRAEVGNVEFISCGSSIKLCAVAEGRANIYPRLGPTMEWDTGAGHAIAESAGARVLDYRTQKPLQYNKENLLNPWFVVFRDE